MRSGDPSGFERTGKHRTATEGPGPRPQSDSRHPWPTTCPTRLTPTRVANPPCLPGFSSPVGPTDCSRFRPGCRHLRELAEASHAAGLAIDRILVVAPAATLTDGAGFSPLRPHLS